MLAEELAAAGEDKAALARDNARLAVGKSDCGGVACRVGARAVSTLACFEIASSMR